MPTLGQLVTYVTLLGNLRAAFVSQVGSTTTITVHALLVEGDADWEHGAVADYANVPYDANGSPGSWH